MKILFLINELERGGAERVLSYLLNQLPKIYPALTPILFILEKSEYAYPIPDNIKIYTGSKFHSSNIIKFIKLPLLALRLKRLIKQNNIKTVLSFLTRANHINILSKYIGSDHRSIVSERNTPSLTYGSQSITDIINRFLIRHFYPSCQTIIAVSKGVQKDLEEKFDIQRGKISVIYNPYDIEAIKQKSRERIRHNWLEDRGVKTIINIGRLEKQKNQVLLVRAFKKVSAKHPEARLLILGEGYERTRLSRLVKDLGIESKVQMPGIQKNPFAFLSKADLFVLSSDFEGFPNVLVEAMICGCPVISTNCRSGPDEIITDGVNGILVPVGNINALSNAIIKILQNDQLKIEFKKNSEKTIQAYELTKIVKLYQKIIIQNS